MNNNTYFQYCQKIVVFNEDFTKILLAKRKGEEDFDGIYSFIGGKMETTDKGFQEGIKREVVEEIGPDARLEVLLDVSFNEFYQKKSGDSMVLPHHLARFIGGDIILSDEYSDYAWVNIDELENFEPKIGTVYTVTQKYLDLLPFVKNGKFIKL